MGGSGRDTAPQVKSFRPGATSHPSALDAQYLLYLQNQYTIIFLFNLLYGGKGGLHNLPAPRCRKA